MLYKRPGSPPLGADADLPGVYGSPYDTTTALVGIAAGATAGYVASAKTENPFRKVAMIVGGAFAGPIAAGAIADAYKVGLGNATTNVKTIWWDDTARRNGLYAVGGSLVLITVFGPTAANLYRQLLKVKDVPMRPNRKKAKKASR